MGYRKFSELTDKPNIQSQPKITSHPGQMFNNSMGNPQQPQQPQHHPQQAGPNMERTYLSDLIDLDEELLVKGNILNPETFDQVQPKMRNVMTKADYAAAGMYSPVEDFIPPGHPGLPQGAYPLPSMDANAFTQGPNLPQGYPHMVNRAPLDQGQQYMDSLPPNQQLMIPQRPQYYNFMQGGQDPRFNGPMQRQEHFPPGPGIPPGYGMRNVYEHGPDCKACNKCNGDRTVYIIIIALLSIICLLLLKKVLQLN